MSIELQPHFVLCAAHGQMFEPKWPAGYEMFRELAVKKFLPVAEILALGPGADERVTAYLLEKPICCRLFKDDLRSIYREIQTAYNIWPTARCNYCAEQRPGAPFKAIDPKDQSIKSWQHLCLECVVEHFGGGKLAPPR
jgi:hypothetical protein